MSTHIRLFSQTAVAHLIGITPSCFNHRIKRGKYPRPSTLREGGKAFHYTSDEVGSILRVEAYRNEHPSVRHCPYGYVKWCVDQQSVL
ncbi:MAG: hypothetical protein KDA86_22400 [Planctomycetaceae bacterium]|nr:hypothetical protein [Planctomycetaceae bacterium]